jgi:hypothetical protein
LIKKVVTVSLESVKLIDQIKEVGLEILKDGIYSKKLN